MSATESNQRTLGLVQMICSDKAEENFTEALHQVREAAKRGAQIICLPELFRTRYFCQVEDAALFSLAEPVPGPSTQQLCALAKELGVVLIASLFEKRTEGVFHNTAVVIDADGSLAGKYRKMHIPDDPCFYEKFYFTPGDLGFRAFSTRFGKIGILICWDQWFPEAARLTALSGAQILFYPTAIGYQERDAAEASKQASAWETIQRSHAVANGVFVAAVNRTGRENALQFWGGSFVCDPLGEILAKAGTGAAETLIVQCDLNRISATRQGWPFLRDRRIDAYGNLTRYYLDENE